MKNVEFGEQLTFEDGRDYVCYGIITDDGKNYIFLSNINDKNDKIVAEEKLTNEDLALVIIKNEDELSKLKRLFEQKYKNN